MARSASAVAWVLSRAGAAGALAVLELWPQMMATKGSVGIRELKEDAAAPAVLAWQKEKAAFEALSVRVLERFRGRYVAVRRGKVIDSDLDVDRLSERVWKKLRGEVFYVAHVGAPPETVEMTAFAFEQDCG